MNTMAATLEQTRSDLAQQGEEVVTTRHGQAVAKLTGVTQVPASGDRREWLAKLAHMRESTATNKSTPTTEEILDDLRGERI